MKGKGVFFISGRLDGLQGGPRGNRLEDRRLSVDRLGLFDAAKWKVVQVEKRQDRHGGRPDGVLWILFESLDDSPVIGFDEKHFVPALLSDEAGFLGERFDESRTQGISTGLLLP